MNNGLNYSERLEAYLRNELSESEKAEFEEMVQQDPLLQNELQLQQDIIASICDYRKSELKQRLNRIDVKNAGRGNAGSFAMGSLIVSGITILGLTGIFVFNNYSSDIDASKIAGAAMPASVLTDSGTSSQQASDSEKAVRAASVAKSGAKEDHTAMQGQKTILASELKTHTISKTQVVQPVVPSDEISASLLESQEPAREHELVMPETRIASSAEALDNKLIVVDNSNQKYKLHYKYTDAQLYLYGLENKYHIIDLPNNRQSYVYYEGNYYKLNKNQSEIAPLPKVTNLQEIQLADSYNKDMKQQ